MANIKNFNAMPGSVFNDYSNTSYYNNGGETPAKGSEEQQEEFTECAGIEDTGSKIVHALTVMKEEGVLRKQYDYAFVMEVMNETEGLPSFNSAQSFIDYLEKQGWAELPSESSASKLTRRSAYWGKFPDWSFKDCDSREALRRVNLGKRFLAIVRKG